VGKNREKVSAWILTSAAECWRTIGTRPVRGDFGEGEGGVLVLGAERELRKGRITGGIIFLTEGPRRNEGNSVKKAEQPW